MVPAYPGKDTVRVILMPIVVHILPMRLWLPVRSIICPRLWYGGSCVEARIRILKYAQDSLAHSSQPTDVSPAPESGNIFSAFGAGLCAGVIGHQKTVMHKRRG